MRNEPNVRIEHLRCYRPPFTSEPGKNYGLFVDGPLRIISSGDLIEEARGWEHVSVSTPDRCPTWDEMHHVKELFWSDDETVVQFHPRRSDYVNIHPFVLHLWKQVGVNMELPPAVLV